MPVAGAVAVSRPSGWQAALSAGLRERIRSLLPGLALAGGVALLALEAARMTWFQSNGISALTLAIVLGMLVGNTLYPRVAPICAHGVTFAKQTLLRLGIVLYGLRLTFQDIGHVGAC
jgi:uncharacterized integral membrane protein (TIGR00698 family)